MKRMNGVERAVLCSDATAWLESDRDVFGSYFTSMPDISEISGLFKEKTQLENVYEYEKWFTNTAYSLMKRLRPGDYAIFLQSDVRVIDTAGNNLMHWIDKSKLCSIAADRAGCNMMWHKLTLNTKIDKKSIHRLVWFIINFLTLSYITTTTTNSIGLVSPIYYVMEKRRSITLPHSLYPTLLREDR